MRVLWLLPLLLLAGCASKGDAIATAAGSPSEEGAPDAPHGPDDAGFADVAVGPADGAEGPLDLGAVPDPGAVSLDPGALVGDPGTRDASRIDLDADGKSVDDGTASQDGGTTVPDSAAPIPDDDAAAPDPGTTVPDAESVVLDPGPPIVDPGPSTPDPGDMIADSSAETPDFGPAPLECSDPTRVLEATQERVLSPREYLEANMIMTAGESFDMSVTVDGGEVRWNVHSHNDSDETLIHRQGTAASLELRFTATRYGTYAAEVSLSGDATEPVRATLSVTGCGVFEEWAVGRD